MKFLRILILLSFSYLALLANEQTLNLNQILKNLKTQDKHILVFFHMSFCPYCVNLINNTFRNEKIKLKIKKDFIFVDINIDDEDTVVYKNFKGNKKNFSKNLKVNFYPTVLFIDKNKEIVYSMKGYRKTKTFTHILNFVSKKEYLSRNFREYLFDNE